MRGSIVKRCRICRALKENKPPKCTHKEAEYSIVYLIGKKQVWKKIGPNKAEAERKLAEVVSEINNGTYVQSKILIFEDFASEFLEYKRNRLKFSTYRSYESMIKNKLNSILGKYAIHQLNHERIESFMIKLRKERTAKTVNNYLLLLRAMLRFAKKRKYINDNPASDVEHVKVEHKEVDFYKPDELNALFHASRAPYRTLFQMAVLTGMRRGEILALTWSNVNWQSNQILVKQSLSWLSEKERINKNTDSRWEFISPKSRGSVRPIIMSPMLRQLLLKHRAESDKNKYDLVFCNELGEPIDPDNMIHREYIPALKRARLRHIKFHSLRHAFTTLLIAQEENMKFIQSQLGHASITTTMDRYGHLLPSAYNGVGNRLDNQLFGLSANARLIEHDQISDKIA